MSNAMRIDMHEQPREDFASLWDKSALLDDYDGRIFEQARVGYESHLSSGQRLDADPQLSASDHGQAIIRQASPRVKIDTKKIKLFAAIKRYIRPNEPEVHKLPHVIAWPRPDPDNLEALFHSGFEDQAWNNIPEQPIFQDDSARGPSENSESSAPKRRLHTQGPSVSYAQTTAFSISTRASNTLDIVEESGPQLDPMFGDTWRVTPNPDPKSKDARSILCREILAMYRQRQLYAGQDTTMLEDFGF